MKCREVSLKEFAEWMKNNVKYTWNLKKGGFSSFNSGGSPLIKYIFPKIDTRDMKVFRIDIERHNLTVDFRDEDDELKKGATILDLLDLKIKRILQEKTGDA